MVHFVLRQKEHRKCQTDAVGQVNPPIKPITRTDKLKGMVVLHILPCLFHAVIMITVVNPITGVIRGLPFVSKYPINMG